MDSSVAHNTYGKDLSVSPIAAGPTAGPLRLETHENQPPVQVNRTQNQSAGRWWVWEITDFLAKFRTGFESTIMTLGELN